MELKRKVDLAGISCVFIIVVSLFIWKGVSKAQAQGSNPWLCTTFQLMSCHGINCAVPSPTPAANWIKINEVVSDTGHGAGRTVGLFIGTP